MSTEMVDRLLGDPLAIEAIYAREAARSPDRKDPAHKHEVWLAVRAAALTARPGDWYHLVYLVLAARYDAEQARGLPSRGIKMQDWIRRGART